MSTAILWLRQDLRLTDNPALNACCKLADKIWIVFIDDPARTTALAPGSASRVWLHHSLQSLEQSLAQRGQTLSCFKGDSEEILSSLVGASGAKIVCWNRCYDPVSRACDTKIKLALSELTEVKSFNGSLFVEPWEACKDDGSPYRVFTPFYRRVATRFPVSPPQPAPRKLPQAPASKELACAAELAPTVTIDELGLLPEKEWHLPMMEHWSVGEPAANRQLDLFLAQSVADYADGRNLPATAGTSRLSPHLHFGEIGPRQILHQLLLNSGGQPQPKSGVEIYCKEIIWREFAYQLLYHFPEMIDAPLDKRFTRFPWPPVDDNTLYRWQRGRTGVPIIDAGMRELWHTGWMHNRVRMIVASYLIKNLLIPWQCGENWFRDTLVDADLASNAMGWQWCAGSGADAAPYFRVFNPVLQGEKFDKNGSYVRQWVPELMDIDNKFLHKPWELPADARAALDYPEPMVDLKMSRQRALAAFESIKAPAAP